MKLTHVDLFSGIGGFSLAAHWAGFETVVFCENDEYCQKVIQKRFRGYVADSGRIGQEGAGKQTEGAKEHNDGIPIIADPASIDRNKRFELGSDRRKKEAEQIRMGRIPIIQDIRDFDGTKWRGATLLTGGFPCQPFSVAGQRKGKDDDRFLWPEMFRVIKEAKPRWVIAENVRGIINMELGQVLSDLETIGYDFPRDLQGCPIVPVIPAAGVNAPHRRDRVWILGRRQDVDDPEGRRCGILHTGNKRAGTGKINSSPDTDSDASYTESSGERIGQQERMARCVFQTTGREQGFDGVSASSENDSDSESAKLNGSGRTWNRGAGHTNDGWQVPWIEIATRFCRVDDGLPPWVYRHRTRRLKALGNAIVPQVAYEIIKGIAEIERGGE